MKRMTVECGCERGGNCNKATFCAIDSALQDQAEEFENRIRFEIESFRDGYAPDFVPHDLDVFMEAIEAILND
jgi:hypothetical protein